MANKQQKASEEAQTGKTENVVGTQSAQPETRAAGPAATGDIDEDTGLPVVGSPQVNDPPAGQAPTPTQAEQSTTMRYDEGVHPSVLDVDGKLEYIYRTMPADSVHSDATMFGYGDARISFAEFHQFLGTVFE